MRAASTLSTSAVSSNNILPSKQSLTYYAEMFCVEEAVLRPRSPATFKSLEKVVKTSTTTGAASRGKNKQVASASDKSASKKSATGIKIRRAAASSLRLMPLRPRTEPRLERVFVLAVPSSALLVDPILWAGRPRRVHPARVRPTHRSPPPSFFSTCPEARGKLCSISRYLIILLTINRCFVKTLLFEHSHQYIRSTIPVGAAP